jgi:hypothetical protein
MSERYCPKRKRGGSWNKGHIPWNKGLTKKTDERVKKVGENIKKNAISNTNFGNRNKRLSMSHRKKIGNSNLGKKRSEDTKEKIRLAKTGMRYSAEINRKKGRSGEQNGFYGRHHTKETRMINRKKHLDWWKVSENRKKILNEEMLERRLKGLFKRPTSLEKQFIELIQHNNLPYMYVGDGSFLIGYKNPDFININGKKICIETRPKDMCKIWNKCSAEDYQNKRCEHYRKYGWKCIIIWDENFENPSKILEVLTLANAMP